MLLAGPLFACIVGVAAIAIVVVTAPIWTALAAQLGQWFYDLFTQAGKNVDDSIHGEDDTDKDDKVKP